MGNGEAQLVLLRFSGSMYRSACRFTRFMLCLRHKFLRDIWGHIPDEHPKVPLSYPFRIKPSDLKTDIVQAWRYHFRLIPDEYDQIEHANMANSLEILAGMGELVAGHGIEWATRLTTREALRQLVADSSGSRVDLMWLDDYGRMEPVTGLSRISSLVPKAAQVQTDRPRRQTGRHLCE
jgi:hypothetical protein